MVYLLVSVVRPEILERTLSSFKENVLNNKMDQSVCFMNVDPNPIDDRAELMVEIARKYFKEVIPNITTQGNFAKAMKWLYSAVPDDEQFFFKLQQDWLIIDKIDMNEMIKMMDKYHSVSIRAYMSSTAKYMNAHGLHKTKFYKELIPKLDEKCNPQINIRELTAGDKGFALYPDNIVMKDLGRDYLRNNKLKRNVAFGKQFISHKKAMK